MGEVRRAAVMRGLLALVTSVVCWGVAHAQSGKVDEDARQAETRIQQNLTAQGYIDELGRIEEVAFPLLRVASPYCSDKRVWSIGVLPRTRDQLVPEYRTAAAEIGLDEKLRFLHVAQGSPLALAGLLKGDQLVSLNSEAAPDGQPGLSWLQTRLQQFRGDKPMQIEVRRGDQLISLRPAPVWVCNVPVEYVFDEQVNAAVGVDRLLVTTGMQRFASDDDELALVLGHEIAHAVLRHPEEMVNSVRSRQAVAILGALLGHRIRIPATDPYSRDKERDADYLGIYLAAAAGFNTERAADFWRRMAVRQPSSIQGSYSSTHPGTAERAVLLQTASEEIARKSREGERLLPSLEKLKTRYDGDYVSMEGSRRQVRRVEKVNVAADKKLPDFTEVPLVGDGGRVLYQKFLSSRTRPRAFAIGPRGIASARYGVNASADALASCNELGKTQACRLYVANDDLVWTEPVVQEPPRRAAASTPAEVTVRTSLPTAGPLQHSREIPESSGFAAIDDEQSVPVRAAGKDRYKHFLTLEKPRAFVVYASGGWRFFHRDADAMVHALDYCAREGLTCWLYAVDDRVVWQADVERRIGRSGQLKPIEAQASK